MNTYVLLDFSHCLTEKTMHYNEKSWYFLQQIWESNWYSSFFFPFKKTYQVAMSENKVLLRVSLKEDIICGIGPDSFLNICGKFLMLFSSHSSWLSWPSVVIWFRADSVKSPVLSFWIHPVFQRLWWMFIWG